MRCHLFYSFLEFVEDKIYPVPSLSWRMENFNDENRYVVPKVQ